MEFEPPSRMFVRWVLHLRDLVGEALKSWVSAPVSYLRNLISLCEIAVMLVLLPPASSRETIIQEWSATPAFITELSRGSHLHVQS